MGIFIILVSTGAGFTLPALRMNRLGGNVTDATLYAAEGLEAAKSIRNQGWTTPFLATSCSGGCGISTGGGFWAWNGANTTKPPYTRTITVTSVERDGNGTIVASGGTDDPNTKKVTSTVTWDFIVARPETVSLVLYVTNWKTAVPTPTPTTCNEYAISQGYSTGTCRATTQLCTNNGETYLSLGDVYCTGGASADTCCGLPGSTPTPTTGGPTPTYTPTPTPTPANCNAYCLQLYGTTGSCLKSNQCDPPMRNEGRIYECAAPDYCCCQ